LNRQFIWYDAYLFGSFNGYNYLINSPDAIVAMLLTSLRSIVFLLIQEERGGTEATWGVAGYYRWKPAGYDSNVKASEKLGFLVPGWLDKDELSVF
jgi:hypothetical protein